MDLIKKFLLVWLTKDELCDLLGLLLTALAFAGLRPKIGVTVVEIETLRRWLDSWRGIGDITVGMARQGYDLQLTCYDEQGWRATFYTTGMETFPDQHDRHSMGADAVAGRAGPTWEVLIGTDAPALLNPYM